MKKKLTICIPTYNRKDRLINQLRSLERQDRIEETVIVISDNASDYDIQKDVISLFEGSRLDIEFHRFEVNTSLSFNILSGFLYSKTDWFWMLSDDDETLPGAVREVLKDIDSSDDVGMIVYSLQADLFPPNKNKIVDNFHGLVEHYKNGKCTSGDMMFISTKVFNLRLLKPFASKAFEYAYNYIPHWNPTFYAFDKCVKLRFSSFPLVQWIAPAPGTEWNSIKCLLGLCSWIDMDFNGSYDDKKWFIHFISKNFSYSTLSSYCLDIKDKRQAKAVYQKIYNTIFFSRYKKYFFRNISFKIRLFFRIRTRRAKGDEK